jgi:adenylate kinase
VRILFVGAPGSGKGTQAVRLAGEVGIPHISTGDILRDAIRRDTDLGRQAKEFIDQGLLVPDEIMVGVVEERFRKGDTAKGYILDGFPRTAPQAEALEKLLGRLGQTLDAVIVLEISDAEVVERITGRRTCETCQTPYHVRFRRPRKEGVCDRDGGRLVQRDDDTEPKVRKRLEKYHSETAAVIPFYEKRGKVRRVDGSKSPDEVYAAVRTAAGRA